jgi:hypothetical protein
MHLGILYPHPYPGTKQANPLAFSTAYSPTTIPLPLPDFFERVIYNHSKVTIIGSVPVASVSAATSKLQFRIEGQIDRATRSKPRQPVPEDRRSCTLVSTMSATHAV